MTRRTGLWTKLRRLLSRLRMRPRKGGQELRTNAARERFWAEVREGEREAEARSRS